MLDHQSANGLLAVASPVIGGFLTQKGLKREDVYTVASMSLDFVHLLMGIPFGKLT
jgi:hypothetical protein